MNLAKRVEDIERRTSPKKRKAIRCVETEAEIADDPDVVCWIVGIPEGYFSQVNDTVRSDDSESTETH